MKPYVSGTSFPTMVDTENKLADLFGFKIVPNGIFMDVDGTIRLIKQGFHVTNEEHVKSVEQLLRGEIETVELKDIYYKVHDASSELKIQLAQTKFKLGMAYAQQSRIEESLKELDEALLLDPDNFLIRKQRWYIRYPEKFSPAIDIDWQQLQLEKERREEALLQGASDCGPDGCVIPGTVQDQ
ncbi:tetratricopeptide repeat protein [Paenibacillus filicis]|uniref:Tetratricopeptide repeat protein n=1 Tax=Paenibacillus gyeongsangnamensis TaxID=3388067 RepID=A0ABT4QJK0_9BACL|nr:tetratricopeptide repeat protein [Paenibacillus filicis]MCZ8516967.1 tetratricopeptide repeat protein [Paenibacillus filicis]